MLCHFYSFVTFRYIIVVFVMCLLPLRLVVFLVVVGLWLSGGLRPVWYLIYGCLWWVGLLYYRFVA